MPDSAIISALRTLIPSLPASNKPFPPLLVSQCESLLTLSRQRASNLKQEEEIARAHACAEIACTRLRAQLRLPAIKNGAGAPCQPRTYGKLLKFLEGTIGDAATGSLTPRGRKRNSEGVVKDTPASGSTRKTTIGTPRRDEAAVDDTPTKKRTVNRNPNPGFAGTIKTRNPRQKGDGNQDDNAPDFVMPSIRTLCKVFSSPSLAPHVFTGTCVVLNLSQTWTPDTEASMDHGLKSDILALITALYLMVLTRMQEDQMTTEIYASVLEKSVATFGVGEELGEKVEEWINRLNEEGWCSGQDWWESVPESVLVFDPDVEAVRQEDGGLEEAADEDLDGTTKPSRGSVRRAEMDEPDPDGILLPGLGTMLHEGIDWTSKDKWLDFEEWRDGLMKSIKTPVKAGVRKGKAIAVA